MILIFSLACKFEYILIVLNGYLLSKWIKTSVVSAGCISNLTHSICLAYILYIKNNFVPNHKKILNIRRIQSQSCPEMPQSHPSHATEMCVCVLVISNSLRPHGLYSPPGSSVHAILQARILEWVAIVAIFCISWTVCGSMSGTRALKGPRKWKYGLEGKLS